MIASGPVPTHPTELLGSVDMENVVRELRDAADFVVIDTAPVLAVSDPLVLAPSSDGVIIVADAGHTSRAAARHVREQLEQVGANIAGGVFNNFDPSNAKYAPSYYRYYYSYQYRPAEVGQSRAGRNGSERKVSLSSPQDLWQ